jgi:hypothetical protein
MNIYYDFQKLIMIFVSTITMSLIVSLFLIQYTHGLTEEQRQANREKYATLIEEDIKNQDNDTSGCIDHNLCGTPSPEFADNIGESLSELQSQVNNNANYRNELINYIRTHGLEEDMVKSGLFVHSLDTLQLERLVRAHMTECLSTSTPTSGFC